MKEWLISPVSSSDTTYACNSLVAYHGVFISNLNTTLPLFFNLPGLGEIILQPGQQFREYFAKPFNSLTIRNPNSCVFIVARCE